MTMSEILNNPVFWTAISAILTFLTALVMLWSVLEMKHQRNQIQQQYEDDMYKKDANVVRNIGHKLNEYLSSVDFTNQDTLNNPNILKDVCSNVASIVRKNILDLSFRSKFKALMKRNLLKFENLEQNFETTSPNKVSQFIREFLEDCAEELMQYINYKKTKRTKNEIK